MTTDRLLLRAFEAGDGRYVAEFVGDREVAKTIDGIPHPYPDGAAVSWISSHAVDAEAGNGYVWAVTRRRDGSLVGAIALHLHPIHRRGDIGYWIGRPYWNQEFASEAAQRVVAFAFQSLALHRVQAFCLPSNAGSARVLERVGFRRERLLRDYVLKWGEFQDRAVYGLLHDAWLEHNTGPTPENNAD